MRAKWGQNFLADKNIARKCVAALDLKLDAKETVLEIGPGKGALTQHLPNSAERIVAVEIDRDLCSLLHTHYGHLPYFTLHNQDFLETDIETLKLGPSFKVVSNLPYAVCAPILQKILAIPGWQTMVLMLQKEVAQRICAQVGQKEYGLLSVAVQAQSQVQKLFNVPPGCFRPVPKVESTVVRLKQLDQTLLRTSAESDQFFKVVRGAFAHRRKTIANSLTQSLSLTDAAQLLQRCGIDPQTRAQQVSVHDFYRLSQML